VSKKAAVVGDPLCAATTCHGQEFCGFFGCYGANPNAAPDSKYVGSRVSSLLIYDASRAQPTTRRHGHRSRRGEPPQLFLNIVLLGPRAGAANGEVRSSRGDHRRRSSGCIDDLIMSALRVKPMPLPAAGGLGLADELNDILRERFAKEKTAKQ